MAEGGMPWLLIWKKPDVRQAARMWAATALRPEAEVKEGERSISGTVGRRDSGTPLGGVVIALARRDCRDDWAERTSDWREGVVE
jgi:hypothetical protein